MCLQQRNQKSATSKAVKETGARIYLYHDHRREMCKWKNRTKFKRVLGVYRITVTFERIRDGIILSSDNHGQG